MSSNDRASLYFSFPDGETVELIVSKDDAEEQGKRILTILTLYKKHLLGEVAKAVNNVNPLFDEPTNEVLKRELP